MRVFIPYTYLIGWSKYNKFYYGAEFSNNKRKVANPKNLWTIYFTSSKYVRQMREKYGEPDIVQVRKIFKSAEQAHTWESKVLTKMDAASDDRFLNLHNAGHGMCCISHTPETKAKMGWHVRGVPKTNNQKIKISQTLKSSSWRIGFKDSNETRMKKSNALKNYVKSPEHIAKIHMARAETIKIKSEIYWNNQPIFTFINSKTGEKYEGNRKGFKERFPSLNQQYINEICSGDRSSYKGWKISR